MISECVGFPGCCEFNACLQGKRGAGALTPRASHSSYSFLSLQVHGNLMKRFPVHLPPLVLLCDSENPFQRANNHQGHPSALPSSRGRNKHSLAWPGCKVGRESDPQFCSRADIAPAIRTCKVRPPGGWLLALELWSSSVPCAIIRQRCEYVRPQTLTIIQTLIARDNLLLQRVQGPELQRHFDA